MAIEPLRAPDAIAERAMAEASAARDLRRPEGMDRLPFDIGGGEQVEAAAAAPLPVYSIELDRLIDLAPPGIDDAAQRGWRVRTVDALGEQLVDLSEKGDAITVRRGQSAEFLKRAAVLAEQRTDPAARYEARLLDFGQLGLSVLWLVDDAGRHRFFSVEQAPRERLEGELLADATARAHRYLRRSDQDARDAGIDDIGG